MDTNEATTNNWILVVLIILLLSLSSCSRYDGTSTMILEDLGIRYELVEALDNNAIGYYDFETDMIKVKRGKQAVYIVLHEVIHKLRKDAKVYSDPYLEEVIACKAAYKIGKLAGIQIGVNKFTLPMWINSSLKANRMEIKKLSPGQKEIVDKGVEVSVQLMVERLKKSGKSMTDIDYVKTGLLLLL